MECLGAVAGEEEVPYPQTKRQRVEVEPAGAGAGADAETIGFFFVVNVVCG